jgi:hypothetical protein
MPKRSRAIVFMAAVPRGPQLVYTCSYPHFCGTFVFRVESGPPWAEMAKHLAYDSGS